MIGAIAGDIIGSVYEHRPIKAKPGAKDSRDIPQLLQEIQIVINLRLFAAFQPKIPTQIRC